MKKFYLIGKDVDASLSPYIHNYVYNHLQIEAEYEAQSLDSPNQIDAIFSDLYKGNIHGINITSPYKMNVFDYINFCDRAAQEIGGINCASKEKGVIKGLNTDWIGFMKTIKGKAIDNVKIIGYGGAGRAVEYALLLDGIKNIQVYTRQKIEHPNNVTYKNITEVFNFKDQKNNIIINATPYHFLNEINFDTLLLLLSKKIFWIDLLYTELSTERKPFLNKNIYKNGLDMLIYQALASIDIWFRKNISKSVDLNNLKVYLNEVINA